MSTTPTAQVLAQWDEWSSRCTDRLFDLDARITADGGDEDQLDIAAVFVARKSIVERIEAMRAASAKDAAGATALAATPLVDEHGALVADDLTSAASLVDAILDRIERKLDARDAAAVELVTTRAELARALTESEHLSGELGSHAAQLADLRAREAAAGTDVSRLRALSGEAQRVLADLRTAATERERLLAMLPGLPARLTVLREREAEVRAVVEEVRAKVAPAPKLAVPSVDALGPPPEHRGLPWPAARSRLQPYLLKVERVGAALDEVELRHRHALERRNELRGLLQAYRDKAGAHRYAEDPRLEPRYREARDVLWSAPCDIEHAEPLVAEYTEAVNALIAAGGPPSVDEPRGEGR